MIQYKCMFVILNINIEMKQRSQICVFRSNYILNILSDVIVTICTKYNERFHNTITAQ